jgi:hypothetical protein
MRNIKVKIKVVGAGHRAGTNGWCFILREKPFVPGTGARDVPYLLIIYASMKIIERNPLRKLSPNVGTIHELSLQRITKEETMTENDFWMYLSDERRCNGEVPCVSGGTGIGMLPGSDYLTGHSLLPANYDKLPQDKIIGLGKLLFKRDVKIKTKEAILIWLAHQPTRDALFFISEYNKHPDKGVEIFAELAMDECLMWNE